MAPASLGVAASSITPTPARITDIGNERRRESRPTTPGPATTPNPKPANKPAKSSAKVESPPPSERA
jgi:hypothetical protein